MIKQELPSLAKKDRKEQTKKLRETRESSEKLKGNITKIAIVIVVLAVIGAFVFVFTRPAPERKRVGEAIPEQGREHLTQGSTQHPPYNSNPPTSGPHWPQQAECKIYTQEVPDEAAIHSLEHGAIWISYKDKNDKKLLAELTSLVKKNSSKILLSPRSKNDLAIAIASWGRLLKLEEFDEQQTNDFIKANINNSPEPFAAC